MSQYKLTLHIDNDDLKVMNEGKQKIVIRKSSSDDKNPNVAWLAFKPMATNTITWETNYGLYASTTQLKSGAKVERMSQLPTRAKPTDFPSAGKCYKLNDAAIFEDAYVSLEKGTYGFINDFDSEKYLTCGLLLAANVNGKVMLEPQSAVLVSMGQTMKSKPLEILEVFIASDIDSGSVLTEITGQKYTAVYQGKIDSITCEYDASHAVFVPTDNLAANDVTKYLMYATAFFGTTAMASWAFNNRELIVNGAKILGAQFKDLDTAAKTFKIIAASASACADAAKAISKVISEQYPAPKTELLVGDDADWVNLEVTACERDKMSTLLSTQENSKRQVELA